MEAEEDKQYKKGLWTVDEDRVLLEHIKVHGIGQWNRIPKLTGLKRCGKSCRLRWLNYLSPNVKRCCFSEEEEDLIIRLHKLLGNRWSLIAGRVPGRTDNQVKNHWNTHLSKKLGLKKQSRKLVKNVPSTTIINSNVNYTNNQVSTYNNSDLAPTMELEVMQDQKKPNLDGPNIIADEDDDQASSSEKPRESPCLELYPSTLCSGHLSNINLSDQEFLEFMDRYSSDGFDPHMWQSF